MFGFKDNGREGPQPQGWAVHVSIAEIGLGLTTSIVGGNQSLNNTAEYLTSPYPD